MRFTAGAATVRLEPFAAVTSSPSLDGIALEPGEIVLRDEPDLAHRAAQEPPADALELERDVRDEALERAATSFGARAPRRARRLACLPRELPRRGLAGVDERHTPPEHALDRTAERRIVRAAEDQRVDAAPLQGREVVAQHFTRGARDFHSLFR